jgi:protein MpaA
MTNSSHLSVFAHSPLGLPILRYNFGETGARLLILGGVHGDEPEGVTAAWGLVAKFIENFDFKLRVSVIPAFNVEGVLRGTRTNSRGVDLNRNLPTKDWSPVAATPRYNPGPSPLSEPENAALVGLLNSSEKPDMICSLHSWNPMLNINGDCEKFAKVIAARTGYSIEPDIGYPTPGSLGTYAGHERKIPTLTYEIQRDLDLPSILQTHVPAILEAMKSLETP